MFRLAILALLVALVAGALGYTGVAKQWSGLAKAVFFASGAIFLVLMVLGFLGVDPLQDDFGIPQS